MDLIIHSGFHGYVLPTGRAQRYGNFLAQGDSGYFPTDDDFGQYPIWKVTGDFPAGMRIVFDVAQDEFGQLYATNIVPE